MMANDTLEHSLVLKKSPVTLDSCLGQLSQLILETKSITALAMTPDALDDLDASQQFHLMSFMDRSIGDAQALFDALVSCLEAETRKRHLS